MLFALVSLSSALWLHHSSYLPSVKRTSISLLCERVDSVFSPLPSCAWPGSPLLLLLLSETVKDRDRELIQQHVWCIFKQLWTFLSFQPTEDLIRCNLISEWNHTAYLSNIKYLPFSLSGHLTENRQKIFYFISCVFPCIYSPFIWHLQWKCSDLSSNCCVFF